MEIIRGLTNWRLTLRREAEGVTILRALTCDKNAVLPDEVFGLPVTALQDRALAPGAKPLEGEEVQILGGAEAGDWDNRGITALTLPQNLRSIGDYAFLNLREMATLRLSDETESIGSASFMNCRAFSRLELNKTGRGQGAALAAIVQSLPQELDVSIRKANGAILRLIFPEYIESYTENTPAHHFELKIIGGGYAYHGVFRGRTLALSDYDALWRGYIAAEHDEDSALRLAYYRLRYPEELGEAAREQYSAWLAGQLGRALDFALREKDSEGLRLLLALAPAEAPELDEALVTARTLAYTEATALLLEKRRARPGSGRARKFEL